MNTKDYTYLLNKPYTLSERQTANLEKILSEFPFLQSARAIYLKGLYNQDSFRYNTELKKTAAYTTDRSVLFDFITSEQFQSVDKDNFEGSENALKSITVNDSEVITEKSQLKAEPDTLADKLEESIKRSINAIETPIDIEKQQPPINAKLEESILQSIRSTQPEINVESTTPDNDQEAVSNDSAASELTTINQPAIRDDEEEKLDIGKPFAFTSDETHSFAEWLKLSKPKPIDRSSDAHSIQEDNAAADDIVAEKEQLSFPVANETINKKMDLIDKFIESNPKIAPVKNTVPNPVTIEKSTNDSSMLMTETLARVYLEQKKYSKAIQAYEILILKYPEKSVFFADRISDIKTIQQNNNLKNDA